MLLAVLWLGGCGIVPKSPLGVVDLPMTASSSTRGEPIPLQLVVMEPEAAALIDSPRVVVRDESGQLAHLAGVALPDRAPRWLQSRLLESLSRQPFAAVAGDGSGLRPDLKLLVRIERFEVDYRAPARASVVLHVLLLDATSGRARASARFEQDEPVEGRGSAAGAESLQRAGHATLNEVADWAASQARGSAGTSD